MKLKQVWYWFEVDSPLVKYVASAQEQELPKYVEGHKINSMNDIEKILDPCERIVKSLLRKPSKIDIIDNWRGQKWAKAGICVNDK
jgi:hypothetical protein